MKVCVGQATQVATVFDVGGGDGGHDGGHGDPSQDLSSNRCQPVANWPAEWPIILADVSRPSELGQVTPSLSVSVAFQSSVQFVMYLKVTQRRLSDGRIIRRRLHD